MLVRHGNVSITRFYAIAIVEVLPSFAKRPITSPESLENCRHEVTRRDNEHIAYSGETE